MLCCGICWLEFTCGQIYCEIACIQVRKYFLLVSNYIDVTPIFTPIFYSPYTYLHACQTLYSLFRIIKLNNKIKTSGNCTIWVRKLQQVQCTLYCVWNGIRASPSTQLNNWQLTQRYNLVQYKEELWSVKEVKSA